MNRILNGCGAALLAMSSLLATGTAGAGGGSTTTTTTTSLNETRIDTVEYDLTARTVTLFGVRFADASPLIKPYVEFGGIAANVRSGWNASQLTLDIPSAFTMVDGEYQIYLERKLKTDQVPHQSSANNIRASYSLTVGSSGTVGPQGPVGPAGPSGPTGPVGPAGPIGLTGPTGATGATGPAGPAGPIGPPGPVGNTGAAGATGPAGPAGPVGATGPTGPSGAAGPQGERGPQGIAGPMGPIGPLGPQGPIGLSGDRGPTGATGATGPQGPVGPTGPVGPAGPEGPSRSRALGRTHDCTTTILSSPCREESLLFSMPGGASVYAICESGNPLGRARIEMRGGSGYDGPFSVTSLGAKTTGSALIQQGAPFLRTFWLNGFATFSQTSTPVGSGGLVETRANCRFGIVATGDFP